MPSRISQMRSGQPQQQTQALQPQYQIDENYLNQLKTVLHSNNSSQILMNMAAQDPRIKQILQMAKGGGSLKALYEQIAQSKGVDPNWLINKLMG